MTAHHACIHWLLKNLNVKYLWVFPPTSFCCFFPMSTQALNIEVHRTWFGGLFLTVPNSLPKGSLSFPVASDAIQGLSP